MPADVSSCPALRDIACEVFSPGIVLSILVGGFNEVVMPSAESQQQKIPGAISVDSDASCQAAKSRLDLQRQFGVGANEVICAAWSPKGEKTVRPSISPQNMLVVFAYKSPIPVTKAPSTSFRRYS